MKNFHSISLFLLLTLLVVEGAITANIIPVPVAPNKNVSSSDDELQSDPASASLTRDNSSSAEIVPHQVRVESHLNLTSVDLTKQLWQDEKNGSLYLVIPVTNSTIVETVGTEAAQAGHPDVAVPEIATKPPDATLIPSSPDVVQSVLEFPVPPLHLNLGVRRRRRLTERGPRTFSLLSWMFDPCYYGGCYPPYPPPPPYGPYGPGPYYGPYW